MTALVDKITRRGLLVLLTIALFANSVELLIKGLETIGEGIGVNIIVAPFALLMAIALGLSAFKEEGDVNTPNADPDDYDLKTLSKKLYGTERAAPLLVSIVRKHAPDKFD